MEWMLVTNLKARKGHAHSSKSKTSMSILVINGHNNGGRGGERCHLDECAQDRRKEHVGFCIVQVTLLVQAKNR
jgi:hypothetical protein